MGQTPIAPSPSLESVARAICAARTLTFISRVGQGAFKETFQVAVADGSYCALKVYRLGFSPERTQREMEAMTQCHHPNIARLSSVFEFDYGVTKYLASLEEYLPGGTLQQRVDRAGLLNSDQAQSIGVVLIDAVTHIASRGLVHRDLKPDNILFRADEPVIVDFGLVRNLQESSLTQTWMVRGPCTPYFASPEQLVNDKNLIDWRSDQFSLGVLLSVCTFGFHPFQEEGTAPQGVVDRVAQRVACTQRFVESTQEFGLPALVKMVSPWPVGRFRKPLQLAAAWSTQRGS